MGGCGVRPPIGWPVALCRKRGSQREMSGEMGKRQGRRWDGMGESVSAFVKGGFGVSVVAPGARGWAYVEMSSVLARVLWLCEVELQLGYDPRRGMNGFVEGRRRRVEFSSLVKMFCGEGGWADGAV